MRQFIIPTFSPDGFSGGLAQRQRDVVADALSTIATLAAASRAMLVQATPQQDEERYDDGLVHSHGWARSSAR